MLFGQAYVSLHREYTYGGFMSKKARAASGHSPEARMTQVPTRPDPPTDEELNAYILTRYALLGIDISVLPESDEDAPMDQERLLQNARSILRQDVTAADFDIDPQFHLPVPHPAPFTAWTEEESR